MKDLEYWSQSLKLLNWLDENSMMDMGEDVYRAEVFAAFLYLAAGGEKGYRLVQIKRSYLPDEKKHKTVTNEERNTKSGVTV